MAEHHNAVKDAILQIERNLGVQDLPNANSLNGILKAHENRFLAPKPVFRAYPLKGSPALKVRFQNFTTGSPVRFLWDFGDGTTSVEKSPIHTYLTEGVYTVRLNIITGTGAQGIVTKNNYITVSNEQKTPFFYVQPSQGDSEQTATAHSTTPTVFDFVDQTDGAVAERYWIFGDGESLNVTDPNLHTTTHSYATPGVYEPSLMVIFANQSLKRVFLVDNITVF
jgi:PKD repeat protein